MYIIKRWNDGAIILGEVIYFYTSGSILVRALKRYGIDGLGNEFYISSEDVEEFRNLDEALDRFYTLIL